MALNATTQKNPMDEREEDPIRTMQKDIAMLQRGEYKPRHFVAPKPVPQSPPTNVWNTKEEQNPLQRLEQSEFKSTEGQLEEKTDGPLTLAEISAQLIKKQASQKVEPVSPGTPKQEIITPSEEPRKSAPISELRNIPEIDILGLENFSEHISPAPEKITPSQDLPPISDSEVFKTPNPPIETISIMGEKLGSQNLKSKRINKEDEHDILGLNNVGIDKTPYQSPTFSAAPTEEIPQEESRSKRRLKLPSISKKLLVIGVVIFIGILAIVGGYIMFNSQNNPDSITPTPPITIPTPQPPPAIIEEPPVPQNSIPTSSDITLTAQTLDEARLQLINSLSDLSRPNNLTRILIKLQTANEIRYLNFAEVLSILRLVFPPDLQNNFDFSNTTLFTYGQAEGTRLGLTVRIRDRNNTIRSAALWETVAYENTKTVLSYLGITQAPSEIKFLDNNRGDVAIRYLNLLSPNLTIDYAVTDTLFIFTTSRDSMFAALEAIGK